MAIQNNANIGFEKQIWDAACVLWGHIPAAEYRKVIVGLIFLRYISSAFEKRYQQLVEEGDGFEDDKDAYAEDNIFFVPEDARWSKIASAAHTPEIGTVIDDAMRAIEKENTMSGNQSIAILVRNRELVDLVEEKLRTKKIIPQILKNRMGVLDLNAKISIGTFHSAKGLEFDMVFLPFCSVKYLPSEERILANEGRDEALKEEAKLLYVAITRAKRGLILSYTAEKTELLLEVDESLYDERELK